MPSSSTTARSSDLSADFSAGHDWRLGRFPNLMPRRVEKILLVSSAYESFMIEEDGLLTELISSEYTDLGLTRSPQVTRAADAEQALDTLREGHFDLVITMSRVGGADPVRFGDAVREIDPDLPIVMLIANELELTRLGHRPHNLNMDHIHVWQGDARLFLAMIKVIEDSWNAEHDTRVGGVGVIILVEDSLRSRSSLLPTLYSELVEQTRSVMQDGLNRMHRLLRLRARPKILIADDFEQAQDLYERFKDYLFGLITDVAFPRGGKQNRQAGLELIEHVRETHPDLPVLLQSSNPNNCQLAQRVNAAFLHKHSSTLLQDLRGFMLDNFGFGDFVFRMPDGREVARVPDLLTMKHVLPTVPPESIDYHSTRNHFSNWLRARTEFVLAKRLRPKKRSEFKDAEAVRRYLIDALDDALGLKRRGMVEDFSRRHFESDTRFARTGGGSLGGKARGLAFFDAMLARHEVERAYPGVRVYVPRSVVIGTDLFDQFLNANNLRRSALNSADDDWIRSAFLKAKLPGELTKDLRVYLDRVRYPIAVRSSSLLEDSQYHPFAGVYDTHMIANNQTDDDERLRQLCSAIKLVYASTFFQAARRYLEATPYRIEEQRMGVILQQLVGNQHDHYFYPSFAGVVRSYNFYPFGHMKPEEGVASVVLGLGQQVAEGGEALRFCPAHPQILPQLSSGEEFLDQSQRGFYAIDLEGIEQHGEEFTSAIVRLDLEQAEKHGTLHAVGSVWNHENQAFYDGISRPGVRAVSFAHVLKSGIFPLSDILRQILELGRESMSGAVEIEFAVNLDSDPKEFAILQMRPYGTGSRFESVELDDIKADAMVCSSPQSLGNGVITGLYDVVYVRPDVFDAAKTPQIAAEVAAINQSLRNEKRECLLIGPGRWGSSNSWLGIPVCWGQVSAARVIVEAGLDNFMVDPSQGSHFFHNLTSIGTAYLTVTPRTGQGMIDWAWLDQQPAFHETEYVRHLRLKNPLEARIDGRSSRAIVLKESACSAPNEP